MGRLIDADVLMGKLTMSNIAHSQNSRELSLLNRNLKIVMDMPTAYDVEKVVEQAHQVFIDELNIVLKDIPEGTPYTKEAHRVLSLNKKVNNAIRNGGKE